MDFDLSKQQTILLDVRNVLGQIVYSKSEKFTEGKQLIEININDFPNGVYFVQLLDKNTLNSAKFIKN